MNELTTAAIDLLKDLIAIPSFSQEEEKTADRIGQWFDNLYTLQESTTTFGHKTKLLIRNNLLLNSHHDTVQPNSAYTNDPFEPKIEDGKLFVLGSNDAGGALFL